MHTLGCFAFHDKDQCILFKYWINSNNVIVIWRTQLRRKLYPSLLTGIFRTCKVFGISYPDIATFENFNKTFFLKPEKSFLSLLMIVIQFNDNSVNTIDGKIMNYWWIYYKVFSTLPENVWYKLCFRCCEQNVSGVPIGPGEHRVWRKFHASGDRCGETVYQTSVRFFDTGDFWNHLHPTTHDLPNSGPAHENTFSSFGHRYHTS